MCIRDSSEGIIVNKRKGNWYIYEPNDVWKTIKQKSPSNKIGENILELLLDLSYKRHGALIIFCEDCNLSECVVDKSSIIECIESSHLHKLLAPKIKEICITCPDVKDISKPLILELASIDGAIIFDKDTGNIKAFGAMIISHKDVSEKGARSMAAMSAVKNNMIPFKVSSDGDITIYHEHFDTSGQSEIIKINFL